MDMRLITRLIYEKIFTSSKKEALKNVGVSWRFISYNTPAEHDVRIHFVDLIIPRDIILEW